MNWYCKCHSKQEAYGYKIHEVTKHCACTYFVHITHSALSIIMATDSSALVCVADFEEYARRVLPKYAFDFYISGAEEEQTLRDNKKAYARLVASAGRHSRIYFILCICFVFDTTCSNFNIFWRTFIEFWYYHD